MSKFLEKIKTDPRVSEAWHEGEDGYWVLLKDEYHTGDGAQAIHEWTVKAVRAEMKRVKPAQECCDRALPASVGKYGCANCNGDSVSA